MKMAETAGGCQGFFFLYSSSADDSEDDQKCDDDHHYDRFKIDMRMKTATRAKSRLPSRVFH